MKHPESETDSVPEQQRSSTWWRLRRWLGFVSSTSQQEGNDTVSNGNGAQAAQSAATDEPELSRIDRIMQESEEKHAWETRWEAGSTYGTHFPQLVIGPQRYPPPSMWGNGVDEKWLKAARRLDEQDRRLGGFDGTTEP